MGLYICLFLLLCARLNMVNCRQMFYKRLRSYLVICLIRWSFCLTCVLTASCNQGNYYMLGWLVGEGILFVHVLVELWFSLGYLVHNEMAPVYVWVDWLLCGGGNVVWLDWICNAEFFITYFDIFINRIWVNMLINPYLVRVQCF